MPKPIDKPEQLTGQEKVELAAEPTSASISKMISDAVKAGSDAVRAEMLEEARVKAQEAAQKVLEDKAADAADCDPANIYGRDFAGMFAKMVQGVAAPAQAEEDNSVNMLAKSAMYLYRANGHHDHALELMTKDGVSGRQLNIAQKTLGISDFTSGGALLQGDMFDTVVEELLSETALVADGAIPKVPVNGQLTIPYTSTGPTTYASEENAAVNASTIAYDQLTLTPKQRTVIVPASKQMLRSINGGASMIEKEMRRSLSVDVDSQLLRGTGASSNPTGLRYLANSSNILNVATTVSVANSVIDMVRLQEAVQNSNVTWQAQSGRYAISPRTWRYFMSATSGGGLYPFQQEMVSQNTLLGVSIAGQSGRGISAIPENLSVTDSSETEIYFYTTDQLLLAIGEDFRMEMADGAAYNNSSGTVVSGFSRDQVLFKLVFLYDFGSLVRGHNVALLSDCDWGV